ncbi:hypothetical protein CCY99_04570 [Helicobacter sp. 16-1353]|uniref:outer membrane beta-barrel protein n=1 Tax=Helicobacter sp. 16-1353 TaxID=2004996 RepID=UPI000DCC4871|nr:outer membrane beta-barrel protein [Helicobacter sp. 16-1353]RAX54290.1 hypothetical protein CCY99_04570 [Helicobacter sp. 16-1353]
MKKLILIVVFVLSLSNLNASNGIFIGADLGIPLNNQEFIKTSINGTMDTKSKNNLSLGLKLGYQHYFLNYIGIRGYVSGNYLNMDKETTITQPGGIGNVVSKGNTKYNGYNIGANIDMLLKYDFNDIFALGGFIGLGYEYSKFNDTNINIIADGSGAVGLAGKLKNINGNGLIYNIGIQAIFIQNHQIELGVKLAPYNIKAESDLKKGLQQEPNYHTKVQSGTTIFLGYRYLFNV